MQVLLIANPVAGRRAPHQIERATAALRRGGAELELFLTGAGGDAKARAAQALNGPYERVIAAGGDGTLNEVINGLAGSDMPLGFIPLGTTNVFALETGIPFQIERAADIALQERPRPVTLGRAGERYFLLMASVGFDGQVVGGVSPTLKRLFGKAAYVIAAVQQIATRPPQLFSTRCKGETFQSAGVLLANARYYGGPFTLTPEARIEKPDLQLCLLRRPGRQALLRQAWSLVTGHAMPKELGEVIPCDELTIETHGIPVQVDGDYLGTTPMAFRCEPEALQLIYPEVQA